MMPRRIGINLLWLRPGRVGGSEESTLASVRALAARAEPDLDLRLFVTDALLGAHPDLSSILPTVVLPGFVLPVAPAARIVAEATWLAVRARSLDLVHHAGGTAPLMRATPYVLTLHDLQPLESSATHGLLKRAYLGATIPPSVRGARHVAVPSDFVRRSVLKHVGVAPERVITIPHGVHVHAQPTERRMLEAQYRLDGPVVLYPAITYPHKNHAVLVQAFADVVHEQPDALLVLTGGCGSEEDALRSQIKRLGIGHRVRRTGRISAADIAGLYGAATLVAVPSRYEGFGMPAAEAMAYGVPLVAAAATALPEIAGEAGVLVDPDDVGAWSEAIAALLADDDERRRLVISGRERAERFSCKANAAAFAALYRAAGSS